MACLAPASAFLFLPACDPAPAGRAAAAPAAAPAAARVGSADDWCVEHAVPESMCTLCSPALAARFEAAGDWCAGHGFPESVCPLCHPLPPPPGLAHPAHAGHDEAQAAEAAEAASREGRDTPPADGTPVRLQDPDVARRAALSFADAAPAGAAPGDAAAVAGQVIAPATIVYDAARHASVTPRAPGVVREVRADLGTRLPAGGALLVIESAEVGADRSRAAAARTRLAVAEAELGRMRELHAQGIVAARDVQVAEQEREAADAERRAIDAALAVAGQGGEAGRYVVAAPIAGTVVRRNVSLGSSVDADDVLFEIADTHTVWAELELPEADASAVAVGQPVDVELDALPGRTFRGALHWIAPEVDPRTRTAKARVRLDNADGALRAGMYGRGRLARRALPAVRALPAPPAAVPVIVPRDAVQSVGGTPLVFVARDARTFVVRRVALGPSRGDGRIALLSGVAPGERVVVDGAYLLKTETLKGSIGAGCCE